MGLSLGGITLLTLLASFSGTAAAQLLGTISGGVVDDATGAPLPGVTIRLGYGATTAITDAAGAFRFTGLKPSDYYLEAEKDGFAKRKGAEAPVVRLTPGENRAGLQIRMQPESVVSGRVLNAKGEPVDAFVTLRDDRNFHVASAQSQKGQFQLRGVAPGVYRLEAEVLAGNPGRTVTFYPSELDETLAESILLRQGEKKSGLQIRLREGKPSAIRGRFTGEVAPSDRLSVVAEARTGAKTKLIGSARLEAEGRFSLNIQPGEYRVKVMTPVQAGGQPLVLGFTEWRVTGVDSSEFLIHPSPIYSVRARFTGSGSGSIPAQEQRFMLNPMDGLGILQYGKPNPSGWVIAPTVSPDRYSVMVTNLAKGTYVRSITAGASDITQNGLDLITGVATDLEINTAAGGGIITGQVMDSLQNPVAGIRLSIWPDSPYRPQQELWSRQSVTEAEGGFTEAGIAPGDYIVTAFGNGKKSPPQNIRISDGQTIRIRLTLP